VVNLRVPGWHTARVAKWRVIADQIIERIRADVDNPEGEYAPGSSPLSVRGLMASEGVANTTAVKVLDELVDEGWLVKVPDIGHFVADPGAGGMPARVKDHEARLARIERHLGLDDADL
jgi:DNA-binding GntR family transcriptional regulator